MTRRQRCLVLLAACALPVAAAAQDRPAAAPERAAVLRAAMEVMQAARYCALITIGPDGYPQARTVDAFAPEDDLTVWIGTNPVTRKVGEIRANPHVTLYYFDAGPMNYVTVLGTAEIIDDPAAKAKYWKEDWASFYEDRNRGSDYVLIRVRPTRLEIVSYTHNLINDPQTWRPISVVFP
jgi:PPOX class probable F420-dependent enzyme